MSKFYRVSVCVDLSKRDDDIRGWAHEIRGGPVYPNGVTCECLTAEMADKFCDWLNSRPIPGSKETESGKISHSFTTGQK